MRFVRSEEHTSELQSHIGISYAVFCLKKREDNNREYYGNVIAELGEERTTQILSDMRTLVEAMEHASKKMHLKEAE